MNVTSTGDSQPEVQAFGYILEALRPKLLDGEDPLDLLPCIIIGALICFSGTVLTDRLHLETLKGFALHTNTHLIVDTVDIARAFGAFRVAVTDLHKHYDDMSALKNDLSMLQRSEKAARLKFSFPDSYTVEGEEIKFTYNSRFDDRKLMFIATTNNGTKVLIKFTQRYSSDTHRFCADANIAPTLYGMYLDPQIYRVLESRSDNNPRMIDEINRIVGILHNGGYVHGDIRDVNMMTRNQWESTNGAKNVVLLDFDWAGWDGTVTYPINVNRTSIKRHPGAKDWKPIKKDHDVFMVDRIFK
ncbi:hypothetical protein CPB86DRAFT_809537 [Serendipita vermifera]|nr:hypothetical protein CPB86DRAFT_809537 [Serendipita vermifera]